MNNKTLTKVNKIFLKLLWALMPWKAIATAPSGTHLLLKDSKGYITCGYIYHTKTGINCSVANYLPTDWADLLKS